MEDLIKFLESRHSVRKYLDKAIEDDKKQIITDLIEKINQEHGTKFAVFFDKLEAFKSILGHSIKGCKNIIIFYHTDANEAGYYSAEVLLKLHELGLNSCYVGLTYKKKIFLRDDVDIQCALAFGYGANQGQPHTNHNINKLLTYEGDKPEKLDIVVKAALSAPTAMNRQRFKIVVENNEIVPILTSKGPFAEFDFGIIRYYVDLAKKN
ncbi:MAG: hypothetical protein MJ208_04495 [Bacilli bacterium]|nr:hypothetical protein [Bacilli bacterium]